MKRMIATLCACIICALVLLTPVSAIGASDLSVIKPGGFVFIADKNDANKAHVIEFHRFGQGAVIVGKEVNDRILAIVGPDDELDIEEVEVLSFTQYKNLFRKADLAKLIQKLDEGRPIGFLNSVTHYSKAIGSVLKEQGENAADWIKRWLDKNK